MPPRLDQRAWGAGRLESGILSAREDCTTETSHMANQKSSNLFPRARKLGRRLPVSQTAPSPVGRLAECGAPYEKPRLVQVTALRYNRIVAGVHGMSSADLMACMPLVAVERHRQRIRAPHNVACRPAAELPRSRAEMLESESKRGELVILTTVERYTRCTQSQRPAWQESGKTYYW
jgi:hypothetical protein